MKRVFLLIVVSALLVALGFAQTPAATGITDQINIKGCLGGSDGNYTVAEDNTGQIFKITTSSADLKPYVGQEVKLVGQKAGAAENSVAVTELNMISEHCTAAAAAPAATVSTPPETANTPPDAAAPVAAAPAATVTVPSETVSSPPAAAAPAAAAPAATVSTPSEAVNTPPAVAAPDATVNTPAGNVSSPAEAAAVHPARRSARRLKPSETPPVAAAPVEPVSTPAAAAVTPAEPVVPPSEAASTPAATKPVTSRSILMLVSIVVAVLILGALVPLVGRWRRRKLLEQTSGQNLSFSNKASSDPGKSDQPGGRKAA
jgi:hypothetical protein